MDAEVEKITNSSKTLFDSSQTELEKKSEKTRGRAKALNKLSKLFIKRMEQLKIPREISYHSFKNYVRKAREAFVATEVDIKNWFPRISPYFILDRRRFEGAYEEAKETLKSLQKFLSQEYGEVKTLEETFQIIDDLSTQEEELKTLKNKKNEVSTNQDSLQKEIEEIHQKMEDLRKLGNFTRIDHLTEEIKQLKKEVRRELRHLQKPIEKLYRFALQKGGLSLEESQKLRHYVEKPFKSFASEETGYPFLKRTLKTIDIALNKGELKLKESRRRKAQEDIHRIIHQDSLLPLHHSCQEKITQKRRLSHSPETRKAKKELQKLRKDLKRIKRRKKRIDLERDRIERELKTQQEKVHDTQAEIENKLSKSLNKDITLQLTI